MERTLSGTAASGPSGPPSPLPEVTGLLDGVPRQRTPGRDPRGLSGPGPQSPPGVRPRPRPWHLVPTPTGTPFTFFYAVVLAVTSYVTAHADSALVRVLHENSSTDVAHLLSSPVPVLVASALWVAGGIASPFVVGFLLVLTALERRIGAVRTAGVFLLGHVLATLATEVPVGLAVLVGHLPDSSLHRLDYGISFGVAASVGALAGLLTPWLRWPVLAVFGGMLLQDLLALTDPLSDWGHLTALAIGVATWPWVRRWGAAGAAGSGSTGAASRRPGRRP
ncbi:rhomboid-like protein [Streptomyces phaeoluteigriseus]